MDRNRARTAARLATEAIVDPRSPVAWQLAAATGCLLLAATVGGYVENLVCGHRCPDQRLALVSEHSNPFAPLDVTVPRTFLC